VPRKKRTEPIGSKPELDNAAVEANRILTTKETQRLMEIDAKYGDGKPYDINRTFNEIEFIALRMGDDTFEMGKRLILLKEHEGHGNFIPLINQLGISPRWAQQFMRVAVKFSDSKTKALSFLGRTKLMALATEDADDLGELVDGGTLAGQTLDEIERMSVRELQTALRKEREKRQQDQETHEQLLANKNKKVDELHKKLHQKKKHTPDWPQRCNELNIESTTAAAMGLEACDQLEALRDAILTEDFGEDEAEGALEMMAVVYYDAVSQLTGKVAELMDACEEVLGGYKHKARPALQVHMEETA